MKGIAEKSRQALTEEAGNRTRSRLSPVPTQGNRTSVWFGAKKSCLHCRERIWKMDLRRKSAGAFIHVTGMMGFEPKVTEVSPASLPQKLVLRRKMNRVIRHRFPDGPAGFEPAIPGARPGAVPFATKELCSRCRKILVAREGAAPSISGCKPDVMLFHQQAVKGRSTGTCTLLCRLKAGCFAV